MATILLNGVVTDASSISGSDLADKLTVSGGVDSLSVDLADGDDAVEIYADSENVSGTEIRVSEGDDEITVVAAVDAGADFVGMPISLGDSLLGGPGDDVIMIDDGLVQLTGAVKGNEGDDLLDVSNINGGTVNGNAGDDTIDIGDTGGIANQVGERGEAAVTNGSVMGGKGDDTITVDADFTGSAVRGNEGDDTINLDGSTFSGATTVNGNAGDDTIDASGAAGPITVIGGQGDDTLVVGNGQTVRGGLGADTFSIEAGGGVTIEDFDKLDLDGVAGVDDDDCFCDDQIQIDGHKVFHTTYTYDVERVKYTSASSWTGDIKVKAVADAANTGDVAVATLAATKTETLSALAVARLLITETKTNAVASTLPAVTYPAIGQTKDGLTFANGLANARARTTVTGLATPTNAVSGTAVRGAGIGQAYASASGYWTNLPGITPNASGLVKGIVAQTTTNFAKGDFSFLDLTGTAKIGVTTNQKLVFNDITQATVKNHWASYNKVKETGSANLYDMNFGTANFSTITTGKAYMVLTDLEDKTFKTTTLDITGANATAKVTLTLNNEFEAWQKFAANQGTTGVSNSFRQITAAGYFGNTQSIPMVVTTTGKATSTTVVASGRFITANGAFGWGTGTSVLSPGGNAIKGNFTTAFSGKTSVLVRTSESKLVSTPNALTRDELFWSTLQRRGLLTLTTTAVNTKSATVNSATLSGVFGVFGINNTNRTKDDYVTGSGKLVMKIAVSATDTARATKAVDTIVKRTTIFGTELPVTTCPDFPTANSAFGNLGNFMVGDQAKQGEITGDFNTKLVWGTFANNLRSNVVTQSGGAIPGTTGSAVTTLDCSTGSTCVVNSHTIPANVSNTDFGLTGGAFAQLNTSLTQGFFSASKFTVNALAAEGFGANAVTFLASIKAGVTTDEIDSNDVPFRVLFFDNEGTDNGLYVVSGHADYNNGALTALDTVGSSATTSNAFGKHTIVKVTGEKGHPIALSDINLV